MKVFRETFHLGKQEVVLETGKIARQSTSSITVTTGGTVVLVTVVVKNDAKSGINFLPLTVNYQEKFYAAGKIPGGFPRREGRPTEHEILGSRLIDRSVRPLFRKNFYNEMQVVATVLSFDPKAVLETDVLALIGTSAALALSGAPFLGPIGSLRVGFDKGKYILGRSKSSELDLVISATSTGIVMIESEANSLPEDVVLGAMLYGYQKIQTIIQAIQHLKSHVPIPLNFSCDSDDNGLLKNNIKEKFFNDLEICCQESSKNKRNTLLDDLRKTVIDTLTTESDSENNVDEEQVARALQDLKKDLMRDKILKGLPRIDGRSTRTIRPINIELGILPHAHGSVLFTRGETQALVSVTLGNDRDAQIVESLDSAEIKKDRYMLHYNFPPFSVGETGIFGIPKRREIGHANLAKRSTNAVFPNQELYPYVVRVVSEITESNGSSSMATICGSSLSMMDAGVPISSPVAGIAMGLIKENKKFSVLSDILGEEDHIGDMDFKVAGTNYGITALQMDVKASDGLSFNIIKPALEQAREGRIHILNVMKKTISHHRKNVSHNAPQVQTLSIPPAKIRDVIGKAGMTIKSITEKTEAVIDVSDDGQVKIFAKNRSNLDLAISSIKNLIEDAKIGQVYTGKVVKIINIGVFVNILPGKDGLLLFSHAEDANVKSSTLTEGKVLKVCVQNIDRMGKIKLNIPV